MKNRPDDPLKKKSVVLHESTWLDIAAYQAKAGIVAQAEAHRRILAAGLRALKASEAEGEKINGE